MIKLERSAKEYGGGSGSERFESDLFRVVLWRLHGGERTTINIKITHKEIHFDGDKTFLSDDDCMVQLNIEEIISMINAEKDKSFEAGRKSKVDEFKKVLSI